MLGRLGVYLQEMFPPWVMVPMGAVHFLSVQLALQALSGREPLVLSWRSVLGSLGVVFLSLALRVQDELKDLETDLRLAKAGDPRYAGRAVVRGAVLPRDLAFLRWASLAAAAALSALLGVSALAAFGVVFVLVWASFHWFFVPSMRERLLLAFATHNPLSAAFSCWCVAACLEESPLTPWAAPLVLGVWAPVAAWEIARKVRVPEEETQYTTYSKILGARVAAALPGFFVIVSAAALAAVAWRAGVHPATFGLLGAAALVPVGACLAFVLRPSPRGAALLRPAMEAYAGAAGVGLVLALALHHGART